MKYTYKDYGCKNEQEFKDAIQFMRQYTYQTFRDAGCLRIRCIFEAEKSVLDYKRKYPKFLKEQM